MNDRRPEFRRMIEAATRPTPPFDLIIVHSFSRFFRDHFELELYVRKLDKNGVKLISVTQEIGDDPMHAMMRQVIALFDEYQSKENGKHVIRALKENARQGFWCGSTPPVGYRVVTAEQRGLKLKKKLDIDPQYADLIRLVYRLALHGSCGSGPMGLKKIASYLNARGITTQNGGRWGIGQIHRVLTRRTYMGEHAYNQRSKSGTRNPASDIVIVPVPPIIRREDFDTVQCLLRRRRFDVKPRQPYGPAPFLKGLVFCSRCGGALTVRPAKGRRYRYYACSVRARQGAAGCDGIAVPTAELDGLVKKFVEQRLLEPQVLAKLLQKIVDRRRKPFEELAREIRVKNRAADDTDLRLRRIYDAIESGVVGINDPSIVDRIDSLRELRDEHRRAADEVAKLQGRVAEMILDPLLLEQAAIKARRKIGTDPAAFRKFLQIMVERVEVAVDEARLIGVKSRLLDGIFHIGNGTAIAEVDWRHSSALNAEDRFRYPIARN